MMLLLPLLICYVFGAVVKAIAVSKGFHEWRWAWFVAGFLLWFVALVAVTVVPSSRNTEEAYLE